jgi:hypothetical protein
MGEGNRNNALHNYGKMLQDGGADFNTIETKVQELNKKSDSPLPHSELIETVLKSIASKMSK